MHPYRCDLERTLLTGLADAQVDTVVIDGAGTHAIGSGIEIGASMYRDSGSRGLKRLANRWSGSSRKMSNRLSRGGHRQEE